MKYFKEHEFACKCGKCNGGFDKMDATLLRMLDEARGYAGIPFKINSAYRCLAHNKAVGGVPNSAHARGYAVDISCTDSRSRYLMLKALLAAGFTRVELAPTWLHVDTDPAKDQDVAFYQKGGKY